MVRVADPRAAEALDVIAAGLNTLFATGVTPADSRDAIAVISSLEVQARRIDALRVQVLADVDRKRCYREDGHASAKVMVRHVADLSNAEALRRERAAKALEQLPCVKAAFTDGRIGFCQAHRIGQAYANKRVRARLVRQDEQLARLGELKEYAAFDAMLTDWVRLADEDGTADRAQRSHENRDAKLTQDYDGSWNLTGGCGSLSGAAMADIFAKFIEVEFLADWDQARREHGDDATTADLARTEAQRRFDALEQIFHCAAAAHAAEGGSLIVTNIVIDLATFERNLRRFAGTEPAAPEPSLDQNDGDGVGYRCSTIDGHPIDAREAVAEALVGHVRRVVVGADSVVTDLGRRSRLFTGAAALAAKLSTLWCYWPGCHVPTSHCQVDHLIPWADHGGGRTNPANGGPACGRHNRHKEHGYRVDRDQVGAWHIIRPDGTEIE